jgi:hypothetical protein
MVICESRILFVMQKQTQAELPTPSISRKYICLPFESEEHYSKCVENHRLFRTYLDRQIAARPELFPEAVSAGYNFHDQYQSRKLTLRLRRIKLKQNREVFTIRPSFVLPYCVARTDQVEKALYLRLWGVPFASLAYVFGRNAMFWYRAWIALGRANLVGATVKSEAVMPSDLIVDEKITWVAGQEVSVPTTASGGCFLGITVSERDNTEGLQAAYGEFQQEAKAVFPAYCPRSVCTDGWAATREAWRLLFPQITLVLCYLHSVIKIAARCTGQLRQEVLTRVWHVYRAETKSKFSQRLRGLERWSAKQLSGGVAEMIKKLCRRRVEFTPAYDCPQAARTSNGVDRLLNHLDRLLYAACYGHSMPGSLRLAVRAMALQWNFHPYGKRLREEEPGRISPFHDLNGFVYHPNWLHNLLIASSMGGLRL